MIISGRVPDPTMKDQPLRNKLHYYPSHFVVSFFGTNVPIVWEVQSSPRSCEKSRLFTTLLIGLYNIRVLYNRSEAPEPDPYQNVPDP
jgi:hypothetical protein